MMRRVAILLAIAVVLGAGVVAMVDASGPRRPVAELEYVIAEANDYYYKIVVQHDLSCNGTELWAANGRAPLDPGTIVLIPPSCAPSATTTTPPPTTEPPVVSTSTTLPPTTTSTTTTTVAPTTTTTPPPVRYGLPVDESAIPAPAPGSPASRIVPATYGTDQVDGVGAFRTNCWRSHMNFDDPIVWPGQQGRTHLHTFYGNTGTDADSDTQSLFGSGNSTCSGGIENRSAYWVPSMIDTATNRPIDQSAGNHLDRVNALQVYYKTGYQGVPSALVQNFPAGLRMIAGSATATGPSQYGPVSYHCEEGGPETRRAEFPACPAGSLFVMSVRFPQCWDGVNLDSPDHKSHMAYGTGWQPTFTNGCPASHPVHLAEITQNVRFRVPAGGMSTWRLSSDTYAGPAGYSGHADWWNGWNPATFQRIVDGCYTDGLDCHMNLLGDGSMLASD